MAVTIAKTSIIGVDQYNGIIPTNRGKLVETYFDLTFDSSYPTGGESFSLDNLGDVIGFEVVSGDIPYILRFTAASLLLSSHVVKAYRVGSTNSALAEVANATDLSAYTVRIKATGYML